MEGQGENKMPTTRKRKTRNIVRTPLLDFIRIFLMHGPKVYHKAMMSREPGLTGKALSFMMLCHGKTLDLKKEYTFRDAWNEHKDEILRIWKAEKRKGRPWAARQFD